MGKNMTDRQRIAAIRAAVIKLTIGFNDEEGIEPRKPQKTIKQEIVNSLSEEWLFQKYWGEKKCLREISALAGVCIGSIRAKMKEFGIERRKAGFLFGNCGHKKINGGSRHYKKK